jgi:hypothetical protein
MRRIALIALLAACGGSDGSGNINPDASYEPDAGYPRAMTMRDSTDALASRSVRPAGPRPAPGTPFRAQHRAQHQ